MDSYESETLLDEPSYSLRGWMLAGWHGAYDPLYVTIKPEGYDHTGYSRTASTTAFTPVVDDAHRVAAYDLVDRMGMCEPGDVLGRDVAAIRCAAIIAHPDDVAERSRVMSHGIGSGETDDSHGAVPDAWEARSHDVTVKRSRKGATTLERKRVGIAPVTGAADDGTWSGDDAGMSDIACLARMLASAECNAEHVTDGDGRTVYGVRRLGSGLAVGFDVQRVTDRHYRNLGVPALVGSDVTAWHQMREVPTGRDPRDVPNAAHRCGISGWYRMTEVDNLAAHEAVHGGNTGSRMEWPMRTTLPIGRHRRDDKRTTVTTGILTTYSPPFTTPRLILPTTAKLVGPSSDLDHRFHGHDLYRRPLPVTVNTRRDRVRKAAQAKAKRDARSIGTITLPETADGTAELLRNLNRGESVTVKCQHGRVTVSRDKSGRYNARITGDRHRVRTATAMAERLH